MLHEKPKRHRRMERQPKEIKPFTAKDYLGRLAIVLGVWIAGGLLFLSFIGLAVWVVVSILQGMGVI